MLQGSENNWASEILGRLAQKYGFASDSALAAHLGVSRQTVGNWRTRQTVDFKLLLDKFPDADLNWMLRGRSPGEASDPAQILPLALKTVLDAGYIVRKWEDGGGPTPTT